MAKFLSRREIEGRIANGETIIVVDGMALKLDAWMEYHPGGPTAILHQVGRDATDEVNALHSQETRKRMKNFKIGFIEGPWINFKPPIQGGHFRKYAGGSVDEDDVGRAGSSGTDVPGSVPCVRERSDSGSESTVSDSADGQGCLIDPQLRQRRKENQSGDDDDASSITTSVSSQSEQDAGDKLNKMKIEERKRWEEDIAKYPSLDQVTQARIVQKYRELDRELRSKGMYDCNYYAYAWEVMRYSLLFACSMYFLRTGWYALSGAFLGLFWHQLTFTAHDAGHMGITHDFTIDTMIGIFIADFCGGLSIGWWKNNHNVHHIVTNEPAHDPDIQHLPFFAIDNRFFSSIRSTYYDRILHYDAFARFFIQFQGYLYYPVLAFARFNLYVLSWDFLLNWRGPKKGIAWWHPWLEMVGMAVFLAWFGYGIVYKCIPTNWERFYFVMISHMITAPLHVQITLSHFAMSTSDMGVDESFPQRMMRTTMDVMCPTWLDFVHGGLQFQAIHHLYPRIPRHNLRRAQPYVQKFCNEVQMPYAIYGFYEGNKEVIGHLAEIGRQATIFKECQSYCEKAALDGHL